MYKASLIRMSIPFLCFYFLNFGLHILCVKETWLLATYVCWWHAIISGRQFRDQRSIND